MSEGGKSGPWNRAPMSGKASYIWGCHLVFQSLPFSTDSPTAIHPIGMALTLWGWGLYFKVYSIRSAVFCTVDQLCSAQTGSPLIGHGSSPRKDGLGWREAIYSHLPPLENSQQPASAHFYHPPATRRPGHGPANSPWPLSLTLTYSLFMTTFHFIQLCKFYVFNFIVGSMPTQFLIWHSASLRLEVKCLC